MPAKRLDKELYRKAYEAYRQWNEAELIDRAYNAGKTPPEKTWQQYLDLFEFAWDLGLRPSEYQRQQKVADIQRYMLAEYRRLLAQAKSL